MAYTEFHYHWQWRLRASPEQLWPFVSDTNRFNRDSGLPSVRRVGAESRPNARRSLGFSQLGVRIEWERPYRFGVRRYYHAGPVASLRVLAELTPQPAGGTHLVYRTWVRPGSLLGRLTVPLIMRFVTRRSFGAAFRSYDEQAMASQPAFVETQDVKFVVGGRARLASLQRQLEGQIDDRALVERLAEVVEKADDFTVARLRPYALADIWGVSRRKVLELCLRAARVGLLDLQWDLLCPLCRGAKESVSTLEEMKGQVHCETCNIDFTANFERSVELTFRVSPTIREVGSLDYCVGGPQVTPHIVAQQLLRANEERTPALPLEEGRYRLRTLSLAGGQSLLATDEGAKDATLIAVDDGWPNDELALNLRPKLKFANATDEEQLFILERTALSDKATTAAEVVTLQAFRDLFSREMLRPGQHISVGSLTVLFTDIRDSTRLYRQIGDGPAFGRVLDHFEVLREEIARESGALIKTMGDAVMAVFPRPVAALRAMLGAQERLASPLPDKPALYLKAGMHHGPCIAVTLNDRLDYFGSVVNMAARLEQFSSGQDIIISDVIKHDPEVEELLSACSGSLNMEPFNAQLKGFDEEGFHLWRVARSLATAVTDPSPGL